MIDQNKTLIVVVLDESGSMLPLKEATLSGLNKLLDEQRSLPGEVELVLNKFSYHPNSVASFVNLKDFPSFNNYVPGGSTALYDAIGVTIDSVGRTLAERPENERPGKVVVVIQTDGYENASWFYRLENIKEKIEHQREKYNWQFLFLGANQDAVLSGSLLGISGNWSITYGADATSTYNVFNSTSRVIGSYRVSGDKADLAYTRTDRKEADKDSW